MIKLLQIEDADILHPDWETIEERIRLLNGENRASMWLYTEEEANGDEFFLIIGGLDSMYFCQYFDGEEYLQVNPLYKEDESEAYYFEDGQQSQLKRNCISLEQAIQATQYYFKKETIKGFPDWEDRYLRQ